MNELPVFISYRQIDGTDLASWLLKSLHGKSRTLYGCHLHVSTVVSPYLDRAAPAVDDWEELHKRELKHARALLVVCSPGAMHEFNTEEDWFYREIRWWLDNRSEIAPILVSSDNHGPRYIPDLIQERWPKAQLVKVDRRAWSALPPPEVRSSVEMSIQSILGGIAHSAGDGYINMEPDPWCAAGMTNIPGLYTWEKDRNYRYINANENYARAAGFNSPQAMLGKKDEDMPWRSLVDLFRSGDHRVMFGTGSPRILAREKEIMVDRVADILVNECALRDRHGEIVGLTGCFWDITGYQLIPRTIEPTVSEAGIPLGKEFGDESLTQIEVEVFRGMVKSLPPERIAEVLNLNRSEIESHINSIKRKLQCSTDGDIVATAVRSGLPLNLFGPMIGGSENVNQW